MEYEVAQSVDVVGEWRVEAINHEGEGEAYVAVFSGPQARQRAEEYALWKNADGHDRRQARRPVEHERRAYA